MLRNPIAQIGIMKREENSLIKNFQEINFCFLFPNIPERISSVFRWDKETLSTTDSQKIKTIFVQQNRIEQKKFFCLTSKIMVSIRCTTGKRENISDGFPTETQLLRKLNHLLFNVFALFVMCLSFMYVNCIYIAYILFVYFEMIISFIWGRFGSALYIYDTTHT